MKHLCKTLVVTAILSLGISPAIAQSGLNIGPTPPPGGGNPPSDKHPCVAVTLAGSVYVRICNGSYAASGAGTNCSGQVLNKRFDRYYELMAGGCANGQQFLGGRLNCGAGNQCYWRPSPAGVAAGFRDETVYPQYQ